MASVQQTQSLKWDVSNGPYSEAVAALGSSRLGLYYSLDDTTGTIKDSSPRGHEAFLGGDYTRAVSPGLLNESNHGLRMNADAPDTVGGAGVLAFDYSPFTPGAKRTVSLMMRLEAVQPHIINCFCDYNPSDGTTSEVNWSMVLEFVRSNETPDGAPGGLRWYGTVAVDFPTVPGAKGYSDWPYRFQVGKRYNIVLRIDDSATTVGNQLCLFINGEKIGPPTIRTSFSSGNPDAPLAPTAPARHFTNTNGPRYFQFGHRTDPPNIGGGGYEYVDATYDEVFVYEGLLTDGQITDLWDAANWEVDASALNLQWDVAGPSFGSRTWYDYVDDLDAEALNDLEARISSIGSFSRRTWVDYVDDLDAAAMNDLEDRIGAMAGSFVQRTWVDGDDLDAAAINDLEARVDAI